MNRANTVDGPNHRGQRTDKEPVRRLCAPRLIDDPVRSVRTGEGFLDSLPSSDQLAGTTVDRGPRNHPRAAVIDIRENLYRVAGSVELHVSVDLAVYFPHCRDVWIDVLTQIAMCAVSRSRLHST